MPGNPGRPKPINWSIKNQTMYLRTVVILSTLLQPCLSIAQFSFSAFAGPGFNHQIDVNVEHLECFKNIEDHTITPTLQKSPWAAGLQIRYDNVAGYYFALESEIKPIVIDYTIDICSQTLEAYPDKSVTDKELLLSFPVAAGAKLGRFHIQSGINATIVLSNDNDLEQFDTFEDNSEKAFMGWHGAAGVSLGRIHLELRYTQEFRNYAEHYTLSGKELEFYGNRFYWQVRVGFDLIKSD